MVFEQIVNDVCERLNLTSDEARSRVGREINNRYRRVTSSIGLNTSRRTQVSKQSSVGNRDMTFTGIERIDAVIDKTDPTQEIILGQITYDEMHITPVRTGMPRLYAIKSTGATSVTITVDVVPTSTPFTLYADGLITVSTLSDGDSPAFPESFHDILIFGVLADEYRKMEKVTYQKDAEGDFEKRLSDLRMFIAKSAYLDITQGRYNSRNYRWMRNIPGSWWY